MPYTGEYTSKKREPLSEETKPHVTTGRRWSILARYHPDVVVLRQRTPDSLDQSTSPCGTSAGRTYTINC